MKITQEQDVGAREQGQQFGEITIRDEGPRCHDAGVQDDADNDDDDEGECDGGYDSKEMEAVMTVEVEHLEVLGMVMEVQEVVAMVMEVQVVLMQVPMFSSLALMMLQMSYLLICFVIFVLDMLI